MKVKTAELVGPTLDWAVAKCENKYLPPVQIRGKGCRINVSPSGSTVYEPSTDWAQGGPIIEREWLHVVPWPNETDEDLRWQCHQHDCIDTVSFGPTPLVAAMRCYVASKLGPEIEVPDELFDLVDQPP